MLRSASCSPGTAISGWGCLIDGRFVEMAVEGWGGCDVGGLSRPLSRGCHAVGVEA